MTPRTCDFAPVEVEGAERPGRWLVTCDHAANTVPPFVAGGDLGLPETDMARHIAYDIGAAGVARELGRLLDAPVVLSNFSRLVIDPNRGLDDPTLLMRLYDGTVIPGNRDADEAERQRRIEWIYAPYHAALSRQAARQADTIIVSVHSFTPQLRGRPPRPWEVGILHAPPEESLSRALIARLQAEGDLTVGDNEPYSGHLPGDAIDRHALAEGRLNTLIEVRNDLIATPIGQAHWAGRLAPLLTAALTDLTQETPHGRHDPHRA